MSTVFAQRLLLVSNLFVLQGTQETSLPAAGSQTIIQGKQQQAPQQKAVPSGVLHTSIIGSNRSQQCIPFENTGFFDLSGILVPKGEPDFGENLSRERAESIDNVWFPVTPHKNERPGRQRQEGVSSTDSLSAHCLQGQTAIDKQTLMPSVKAQIATPFHFSKPAGAASGSADSDVSLATVSEKPPSFSFSGTAARDADTNLQDSNTQAGACLKKHIFSSSAGPLSQTPTLMTDSHITMLSSSRAPSNDLPSSLEVTQGSSAHLVQPAVPKPPQIATHTPQRYARPTHRSLFTFTESDKPLGLLFAMELARSNHNISQQVHVASTARRNASSDVLSSLWLGDDLVLELVRKAPFAHIGSHILAESSKLSAMLQGNTSEIPSTREEAVCMAHELPAAGINQLPMGDPQEERESPIHATAGGIHILRDNNTNDTVRALQPQPDFLQAKQTLCVYVWNMKLVLLC